MVNQSAAALVERKVTALRERFAQLRISFQRFDRDSHGMLLSARAVFGRAVRVGGSMPRLTPLPATA